MNTVLLQKQLRDNANDLQEFCKDLQNWGQEMKRKESCLTDTNKKHSPVVQDKAIKTSQKKVKKVRITEPTITKKKSATDYAAWDKFDVEAECGKLDDEEFEESDLTDEHDETKRDEAMIHKDKGNQYVKNQKWNEAITCYTKAIACYSYDPVYFANRALCYLKINQMQDVIEDCTMSLKLDPTYVKAYQRRAAARESLHELDAAKYDLQQVLKYETNNKESKLALDKLNKKIETQKLSEPQRPVSKFTATRSQKILNTDPKQNFTSEYTNALNKEVKKSINQTLDCSYNVSSWPSGNNVIIVKPTKKPPHLQSKKPLKRIQIIDVDSATSKEPVTPEAKIMNTSDKKECRAVKDHVVERPMSNKDHENSKEQLNVITKEHTKDNVSINSTCVSSINKFPNAQNNMWNLETDKLKVTEKISSESDSAYLESTEKKINKDKTKSEVTKIIETHPPSIAPTNVEKDLKNFDNGIRKFIPAVENLNNITTYEPKTAVQFYGTWKQLKDTNLKYQYLSRHMKPETLPSVFKESLDSDTFSELIKIFADHYIPNKDPLYQYLYNLSKVKRFSALTLFMSTNDKNNLWKIIYYIKQGENIEEEKVEDLITKYEL